MKKKKSKGRQIPFQAAFLLLLAGLVLSGCAWREESAAAEKTTQIVLTTGFLPDEVFRLENTSCSRAELMVYLVTEQNGYEAVYGAALWESEQGKELEERLKNNVLAEISQVKAMILLAERKGIALTEEEKRLVSQAAEEYYDSLNDREKQVLEADPQMIEKMYEDYALADKVYRAIIGDINPEISDDEARIITVQHIFLRTATRNADGTLTPYSDGEKEKQLRRALQIKEEAEAGETFEALIEKYSEDTQSVLSFGMGETESAFEEAAFNLGNGEISGIVETREGYEILRCVSTFNREETDRNKLKIVEKRRAEVFGQEYDAFVDSLARNLNEPVWESVALIHDEKVTTDDFFDVYNRYFASAL